VEFFETPVSSAAASKGFCFFIIGAVFCVFLNPFFNIVYYSFLLLCYLVLWEVDKL